MFGIDIEGHGKSDGIRAFIDCFSDVVSDSAAFFKSVRGRPASLDRSILS